MEYVALGDSITAGEKASSPVRSYPCRLVSLLRRRKPEYSATIFARPGWTSEDLLKALTESEGVHWPFAKTITIWSGGDDLIDAGLAMLAGGGPSVIESSLKRYRRDLGLIIRYLRTLTRAQIVLCTQYNPFPATTLANTAIAGLNEVTASVAKFYGASLAPVDQWFRGNEAAWLYGYRTGSLRDLLTGARPVHPNDQGHAAIAQGLSALIR